MSTFLGMTPATRPRTASPLVGALLLLVALLLVAVWALGRPGTIPVYSQDWQGDHYLGKYACANTSSGDVACQDLPADLGPYVQCRLRPDGPNSQPFVRCANHPDSNRFEEVK